MDRTTDPLILEGVTSASGSFFAFGYEDLGNPAIIASQDGYGWHRTAIDPMPEPGTGAVKGLAAGGGQTVAIGSVGGVTRGYSRPCAWVQRADGTWQVSPLCDGTTYGEISQVVATDTGFAAVGVESETLGDPPLASWVSTDGLAWDRVSFPRTVEEVTAITLAGHRIVALGFTGRQASRVYSSSDGRAWRLDFAFPKGSAPSAIAYGHGHFVATDLRGYPWWSRDGRHWSVVDDGPSLTHVSWTGDAFVATPVDPASVTYGVDATPSHPTVPAIWTSDDGRAWSHHTVVKVPILSASSIVSAGGRTLVMARPAHSSELWVGPADLPDTSIAETAIVQPTMEPVGDPSGLLITLGGLGGLAALRRGRRGSSAIRPADRPSTES